MKPRLIGVNTCQTCKNILSSWKKQGVDFEYWDGDQDDLQDKLDEMKVKKFPVIQIVDDEERVLHTWDPVLYPKGISFKSVQIYMEKLKNARR